MAHRGANLGLDHPTRRHIYDHLLRLPGDHFRSIARSLGLAVGTATHHLEVLMREGLLGLERSNGRARYYPRGSDAETDRNRLFMRHWNYRDLRLRILYALARRPGARVSEVARELGVSRQLVSYHLARLGELDLVRREGDGYRALPAPVETIPDGPVRVAPAKLPVPLLRAKGRAKKSAR